MFGIRGWKEEMSTHMWLRECIHGLGVSKKMRKILKSHFQNDSDYILPWKTIKEELANPLKNNIILNSRYLLTKCYVKDLEIFLWLQKKRGQASWDLKYSVKQAINPS